MMNFVPNQIPLDTRLKNLVFAAALLAYGCYGIYINDFWVPGKRRVIHLSDEPALIMFAALVCGSLILLSVVVDHYDRRNNEHKYKAFAGYFRIVGFTLFFMAFVIHFIKKFSA